jgi:hypothetical protein
MRLSTDPDLEAEPPLDPVLERVQARLRRLILISGSTLMIGLLAVVFAVIYRASSLDRASGAPWSATAEIPVGATVVATDVDGDRLSVTIEDAAGRRVLVFDLASGRRLGETAIVER